MKTDLDSLMQARNFDTILVLGPGQHNPPMVYLTGGAHLTEAYLIKKRAEEPVLFHRTMERDEANRSGLATKNLEVYHFENLLQQANGNMLQAMVARFKLMFQDLGIEDGQLAIYGQYDAGEAFSLFSALEKALPDIKIVGEKYDSLLLTAMITKDQHEVDRIRQMGKIATQVMEEVADFITSQSVQGQTLINTDGEPVTIGAVKRQINLLLAERGAENPKGAIFAAGYDAGVPHSAGTDGNPLYLGQTIIFDLFPCEAGGGYFYDMTRTWCLGYAPDEAQALYEDVLAVYQQIMNELRPGEPFKTYQKRACEIFKARGHATIEDDPLIERGYVHALGHGLGLHVHERPFSRLSSSNEESLDPGVVFTIEPGLYYPKQEMGIRLEDTVWARPDGSFEILAPYPLDLILPMK